MTLPTFWTLSLSSIKTLCSNFIKINVITVKTIKDDNACLFNIVVDVTVQSYNTSNFFNPSY